MLNSAEMKGILDFESFSRENARILSGYLDWINALKADDFSHINENINSIN